MGEIITIGVFILLVIGVVIIIYKAGQSKATLTMENEIRKKVEDEIHELEKYVEEQDKKPVTDDDVRNWM